MPSGYHQSGRLSGGLFGVIALALAGSGVGVVGYWAMNDEESERPMRAIKPVPGEAGDNTVEVSDSIVLPNPVGEAPLLESTDGPDRLPAQSGANSGDAQVVKPKPRPKPDVAILEEAAFIVRFNDHPELDRCLDLFRKDKAAARKEFAKWASRHPELDGMSLERVNYSGEAILHYRGADDANPATNAKAIQARLNELSFVRYADPDYTAFPGKGE